MECYNKKEKKGFGYSYKLGEKQMLWEGLEPSRPKGQRILSPLCLPIPPPKQNGQCRT